MSGALTVDEHVAAVQSLFVLDEAVFEELKSLKQKRADLAARLLALMRDSDVAKAKGLDTNEKLKAAMQPTKKDANVIGAQGMICDMIGLTPPPPIMGVFWCA